MILADKVARFLARPEIKAIFDPDCTKQAALLGAKRFVLDEAMSAYTADLGLAPLCSRRPHRQHEILDEMRKLARLPFKTTWLELNLRAYMRRAAEEYGDTFGSDALRAYDLVVSEDGPETLGWLILATCGYCVHRIVLCIGSHDRNI